MNASMNSSGSFSSCTSAVNRSGSASQNTSSDLDDIDLDPTELRLRAHSSTISSSRDDNENGTLSRRSHEEMGNTGSEREVLRQLMVTQNELLRVQRQTIAKLDAVIATSGKKKQPAAPVVSNFVKNLVHNGYKEGLSRECAEWVVEKGKSIDCQENKSTTSFIRDYAKGISANISDDVLHAALTRYFQTKKESASRARSSNGGVVKEKQKLYERKNQKKRRRMKMVGKKTSWSNEKKEKVRAALTMEMMSSEDEAEDVDGRQVFVVKPLPWQTPEFLRIKEQLDSKFERCMSQRSRRQFLPRAEGDPSVRPRPRKITDCISWAIL